MLLTLTLIAICTAFNLTEFNWTVLLLWKNHQQYYLSKIASCHRCHTRNNLFIYLCYICNDMITEGNGITNN